MMAAFIVLPWSVHTHCLTFDGCEVRWTLKVFTMSRAQTHTIKFKRRNEHFSFELSSVFFCRIDLISNYFLLVRVVRLIIIIGSFRIIFFFFVQSYFPFMIIWTSTNDSCKKITGYFCVMISSHEEKRFFWLKWFVMDSFSCVDEPWAFTIGQQLFIILMHQQMHASVALLSINFGFFLL